MMSPYHQTKCFIVEILFRKLPNGCISLLTSTGLNNATCTNCDKPLWWSQPNLHILYIYICLWHGFVSSGIQVNLKVSLNYKLWFICITNPNLWCPGEQYLKLFEAKFTCILRQHIAVGINSVKFMFLLPRNWQPTTCFGALHCPQANTKSSQPGLSINFKQYSTRSVFFKIFIINMPEFAFLSSKFDWCTSLAVGVVYAILCYIGSCYNGNLLSVIIHIFVALTTEHVT